MSSHRPFPDSACAATIAAYFHAGLTIGLLDIEPAKEWAFSIVSTQDTPSIAAIEIAIANDRLGMLDALDMQGPGADTRAAARWLMDDLRWALEQGRRSPGEVLRLARDAAQIAGWHEVIFEMDQLEDERELMRDGVMAGSPGDFVGMLAKALADFAAE